MRRRAPIPAVYVVLTSTRALSELLKDLAKAMRVLEWGQGTVEDPSSFWFEVTHRDRLPDTGSFMTALTENDVLRVIQPVLEGGGKDLARQIPLISRRENGLWRDGVICGQPPLSPESERLLQKGIDDAKAGRVTQMPLFDKM